MLRLGCLSRIALNVTGRPFSSASPTASPSVSVWPQWNCPLTVCVASWSSRRSCERFSTANSTFSSFTKSASQSISGLRPLSSSSAGPFSSLCVCSSVLVSPVVLLSCCRLSWFRHSRAVSLSARPCNLQHLTFAALHSLLLPLFAWYFNLSKISVSAGIYFLYSFESSQWTADCN